MSSLNGMKTPPLTWVRAFCEAGRQGSFKQAAAALNLAPSTVSHEIRKLEDRLGQPLFDRGPRRAQLTEAGRKLYALVEPAFDQLDAAFVQFADTSSQPLRIGVLPFMANELVLPQLAGFEAKLGSQQFEIGSTIALADLSHNDPAKRVDAIVRYAEQAPAGYEAVSLTKVSMALVAGGSKTNPKSTTLQRRVKLKGNFDGWERMRNAGFNIPPEAGATLVVDNYLSAMRAVEQGTGIGLAVLPLCESWLHQGRIHLLDGKLCAIEECYWLVWRQASPKHELLLALGNHMRTEFDAANQRIAELAN